MIKLLEALYTALESKTGVILETDNPRLLMQRLYKARAEADDPALAGLTLIPSPLNANHLWIVRNGQT